MQTSAEEKNSFQEGVCATYTCRILSDFSQLEALASTWEELWRSTVRHEIFQHFGWVKSWWEAYGAQHQLFTPVVAQGSNIIGILPLLRDGRTLRYAGYMNADYINLICEPEASGRVLVAILQELDVRAGAWDVLELNNIPEDSQLAGALRELPSAWHQRLRWNGSVPCPTLVLGAQKGQILAEILAKDKLKKAARYLERRGAVTFRHLEDPIEARRHLELFIEQHVRRQPFAGRSSALADRAGVAFCKALLKNFDLARELRFSVLEVGERPAAYHLGFSVGGRYLFYKPTFDVNLWELPPGQVLLYHLFQYLVDSDLVEFDFSLGGESYKYRFANDSRQNLNASLQSPTLRAAIRSRIESALTIGKATVKKRPQLHAALTGGFLRLARTRALIDRDGLTRRVYRYFIKPRPELTLYDIYRPTKGIGVTVLRATLGDLADRANRFTILDPERLNLARERLRKEALAYLAEEGDRLLQVVWVYTDPRTAPELARLPCSFAGPRCWIVSDSWNAKGIAAPFLPGILERIAGDVQAAKTQVRVARVGDNRRTKALLTAAGCRVLSVHALPPAGPVSLVAS